MVPVVDLTAKSTKKNVFLWGMQHSRWSCLWDSTPDIIHPKPEIKTHMSRRGNPRYIPPQAHRGSLTCFRPREAGHVLDRHRQEASNLRNLSIGTMPNHKLVELSREASGGKLAALRELLRFLRKDKVGISILSTRGLVVIQQ